MPRVHSVDFLRGIFAALVFAYHLLYVNHIAEPEIVAYYAVYGFFVISGFSLYITYHDRLEIRSYAIRRFFRIAPLFYVVLFATPLVKGWPDHWRYTLPFNLTLTFGLWNPGSTSLVGGGWSIGIEMVFYLLFPVILYFPLTAFAVSCPLAVIFDNVVLARNLTMLEPGMWGNYTQPIATLVYFAAGAALGKAYKLFPPIRGGWVLSTIALVPFCVIQSETNPLEPLTLLKGYTGIVLMFSTIAIVAGSIFCYQPPKQISYWLGELSYPVYLIHPLTLYLPIETSIAVTLVCAFAVNILIEKPLRSFGRKLAFMTRN